MSVWTMLAIWCGLCVLWLVAFIGGLIIVDARRCMRLAAKHAAEDARRAAMTKEERDEEGRMAALVHFGIYVPPPVYVAPLPTIDPSLLPKEN